MPELHLLADYESLLQQHQAEFTPSLAQLEASINETLRQLRQQEQSIVDAQIQQLAQIQGQLATDVRCLLNSVELQAFMAELKKIPAPRHWDQSQLPPQVDDDSANWQIAQTDFTLAIRDYEATVDHDGYDDERTHSIYGYTVTVQIGNRSKRVNVITRRVYSPVEERPYNLRDQDYYLNGGVYNLLEPGDNQDLLAQEISYLFGCAARLLSLSPRTIQFQYSSVEAAQ